MSPLTIALLSSERKSCSMRIINGTAISAKTLYKPQSKWKSLEHHLLSSLALKDSKQVNSNTDLWVCSEVEEDRK